MSAPRINVRCLVVGRAVRVRVGSARWTSVEEPTLPAGTPRLDGISRAAAVAAHVALTAAVSALGKRPPDDRILLWATMPDGSAAADRSYWETAADAGGALASPQRFVATLPSSVAGDVALTLGLHGPCVVIPGIAPPRGGVPLAALDVACDAADLLLCLTVASGAGGLCAQRVLAVALAVPAHVPSRRRAGSLRTAAVGSRGGRARGG